MLTSQLFYSSRMRVIPVPCRSDNYMYILVDEATKTTAVVDPYDPEKLAAAANAAGVTIGTHLFTTHHHADHSGGNAAFVAKYPDAIVYAGSDKAPGATHLLKHMETFKLGALDVTAVHTPCHTQDHICFYVEDKAANERGVFTGCVSLPPLPQPAVRSQLLTNRLQRHPLCRWQRPLF